MARIAGVEFLGAVPMDSHVRIGGDSGKPVIDYEPESEVSKTFVTIAQRVAAKLSIAAHVNRSPEINVV